MKERLEKSVVERILARSIDPLEVMSTLDSDRIYEWETDFDAFLLNEQNYVEESNEIVFPIKLSNGELIEESRWDELLGFWSDGNCLIVSKGGDWGMLTPFSIDASKKSAKEAADEYAYLPLAFPGCEFHIVDNKSLGGFVLDLRCFIPSKMLTKSLFEEVRQEMEAGMSEARIAQLEKMGLSERISERERKPDGFGL